MHYAQQDVEYKARRKNGNEWGFFSFAAGQGMVPKPTNEAQTAEPEQAGRGRRGDQGTRCERL